MREAGDPIKRVESGEVEKIDTLAETAEKNTETFPPIIPLATEEKGADSASKSSSFESGCPAGDRSWKFGHNPFAQLIDRIKKMKPLTQHKVRQWMEQFLKLMDKRKRKEVAEEKSEGKVSIKLGLMTGKNELACDFCEVCDHFYPGAVFADVYVNGRLQWMMCPNCLLYCKEQANGSLEQNIRARFHKLAHRLEKAARQARGLAVADEFHTPTLHEWEAWETASFAVQEVASAEQRWEP